MITPNDRSALLDYASKIAKNKRDAYVVTKIADSMAAWVNEAAIYGNNPDGGWTMYADMKARMTALDREFFNIKNADGSCSMPVEEFIANAEVFYRYLVADVADIKRPTAAPLVLPAARAVLVGR